MPLHRCLFFGALAVFAIPAALHAQCGASAVAVPADRDATLYENLDDANGAGDHLFAGRTWDIPPPNLRLRRALVRFDVAAAVPPGSTVSAATLWLNVSRVRIATAYDVRLHPVLKDWGEGTSHAAGPEGIGTAATPGDATWFFASFNTDAWTTAGGDFGPTSATASVGGPGLYAWTSAATASDVQGWLDAPATNFGWIVIGDEAVLGGAKRFDSRTNAGGTGPLLCVTASLAPAPPAIPVLDPAGLALLAGLLALLALGRLRQGGRP